MDAHEFYLCFGASYVLMCQLELKLFKYNYKNWFILVCVLWRIIALDHMTSLYIMHLVLIDGFPRVLPLFWCKLCGYMLIRTEVMKI